jgi:hypothetical protein
VKASPAGLSYTASRKRPSGLRRDLSDRRMGRILFNMRRLRRSPIVVVEITQACDETLHDMSIAPVMVIVTGERASELA